MPLAILHTSDERLISQPVVDLVRKGLRQGGVVVLAPTFAQALEAQKCLAEQGLGVGIEAGTPRSWARDRWDVWGDGRRVVDAGTRLLVMCGLVRKDRAAGSLQSPGTIRLLCDLAERCLPWIPSALDLARSKLTEGEARALELMADYDEALAQRGLVEGSAVMDCLVGALREAGVGIAPVVLVGFDELPLAERVLVASLAQKTAVTFVAREAEGPACDAVNSAVELLRDEARSRGVEVCDERTEACGPVARAPELASLRETLFGAGDELVVSTGAVRLLEASGPLAEAELVAREVVSIASEIDRPTIAVAVPDVRRWWRELVPKLVARGVASRVELSVPVLATQTGRAFMGYARTVAHLSELDAAWPAPVEGADGTLVRLGPMDWWPPQELLDFLLSDVSHVEPHKAYALDVAWRGNRLLTPRDVLDQLLSAKATSDAVERSTRELLRGRLGSAASKLLGPYAPDAAEARGKEVVPAREQAVMVLSAIMGVAGTLKELGVTADPACAGAVPLSELVAQAELALASAHVTQRLEVPAWGGHQKARAVVLSRGAAAQLAPGSVDAAILCGMTSQELAVPTGDGVLEGLLEALALEPAPHALARQRSQFFRLCSVPRKQLLFERVLFSADAHEAYPAVMLGEALACYAGDLPVASLAEDDARNNLSIRGVAPDSLASEAVAPAGLVDDSLRRLVVVPPEGREELPGGLPVLSASQLESYLECPLKWFSLRRLRLATNDAGFGPLEMGTFAHRVLELTYAQLFAEGTAQLGGHDEHALAHARDVLDACFSLHEEHQYLRAGSRGAYQALVAHTSQEEGAAQRLRQDLLSTLDYVAERFEGYAPTAFEWEFGRGRNNPARDGLPTVRRAEYAGVAVTGTVDRIDVNAHGQAVIIDYKHKGPGGFFGEYAVFGDKGLTSGEAPRLPRRIQSLMYAQVVRRAFPELKVVGALYLGTRGAHELSGAVTEGQADAVFGGKLSARRATRVVVPDGESFGREQGQGMEALLDAVEDAVANKVERLRQGHIEANPVDADACLYCPVSNCQRRVQR